MLFTLLRSSAIPTSPNCRSRSTRATVDFRRHIAAYSGDVDDGDVCICATELVQERGLVGHCPDEDQPVVDFERGSRVRDDLRLGLQHKYADWADRIHHRAIPNDCTRYVMSTLRVVTSCVSARERTARSIVA